MTTTDLPLLVLGRGTDPDSERGVDCPGGLPPASDPETERWAKVALQRMLDLPARTAAKD